MRRRLAEETVLFISVLKWVLLASLIGIIVGISTTIFLESLNWSIAFTGRYSYFFLLLPAAFFLTVIIIKYLAPDAEGHGTEKVIEAIHKRSGKIKVLVVPVKLIATVLTIATGGSAGKEGPCAQIGAGLASKFVDIFKFGNTDRKKLVICGISAGFASVFGTPIAGAMFGIEVLFVGSVLYEVLLPSFIAGIISYQVSSSLGIAYFHHAINVVPVFSRSFFIKVILAGVFFGICSVLLIELLKAGKFVSGKLKFWAPLKGVIGGAALILLAMVFSGQYLGLGLDTIQSSLGGAKAIWYAFILKAVFTSITLNFGGSGGIVTPIFFIGATAGAFLGDVFGMDIATFSSIGMVALLAGAANTPIAASIMAIEMFGPKIAPYAALACVISFLMTGHRSVYPSQILSIKKSESFEIEIGKEMEGIKPKFHERKRGIIHRLYGLFRKTDKK
ncbi:MAG: chloride channel protein [Planctomycetes bacterium]|nr:chloride channel protein [Planctomycetota bacterium]